MQVTYLLKLFRTANKIQLIGMMNSIVSNISPFDSVQIFKNNIIKTESTRTLSITWTKLCTKIIFILLQTSVLLFQIYYQKKSFLTTSNIENKFCSSTEFQWIAYSKRLFYKIAILEILPIDNMVLVNLENHFLRLWLEILVGVITDNYLHL